MFLLQHNAFVHRQVFSIQHYFVCLQLKAKVYYFFRNILKSHLNNLKITWEFLPGVLCFKYRL